jgi:hypothetical protein
VYLPAPRRNGFNRMIPGNSGAVCAAALDDLPAELPLRCGCARAKRPERHTHKLADMTATGDSPDAGRAWARRLLVVIPLLGAIFFLHGVQCGGDDHGTEHTLMALAAPQAGGMVHALSSGPDGMGHPAAAAVTGSATLDTARLGGAPTTPEAPVPSAGVCFVLLTAALVVLVAVLARRRRHTPESSAGIRATPGPATAPPRPPSLAQLCLLRI